MPVNLLDMSTLPKISREEQGKCSNAHDYMIWNNGHLWDSKVSNLERWPSWREMINLTFFQGLIEFWIELLTFETCICVFALISSLETFSAHFRNF